MPLCTLIHVWVCTACRVSIIRGSLHKTFWALKKQTKIPLSTEGKKKREKCLEIITEPTSNVMQQTLPILYGMRSIHPPEIDPGLIKNNNNTSKQANEHKAYLQIFYFISKIFIITPVIIFSLYCFFSQRFDLVFRLNKFFFKLFGLIMENRTKDRDFWNIHCLSEPLGNKQSE